MRSKQIKKNLVELLSDSTAYGVPKIFKSKRPFLRKFWLTFFLVGFFVSIGFIHEAIINYLDFEVITKIESIYEQPMPFPTISFCPQDGQGFENITLKQLIKQCWHNLDHDCEKNPENYFETYQTFRGVCYRFNSGKNFSGHSVPILNSIIGGRDDSLKLRINYNNSLHIYVHEAKSPPKSDFKNNHVGSPIFISSSSETHLILHKIVEKKLGLPYNKCYQDVELFPLNKTIIDYIKSTNVTYNQVNCLELCYEIDFMNRNECECNVTSLGQVWTECWDGTNLTACIYTDKLIFFKESVVNKCKEYCPLECASTTYSVISNLIEKSNSGYADFFVYFETLKYTSVSQSAKAQLFDLISAIGGIFGMFVGLSFVSLFEIIELFIEVMLLTFKDKKHKFKHNGVEIGTQTDYFKI